MTRRNEKRELIGPADARVSTRVYPSGSDRQAPDGRVFHATTVTNLASIAHVQIGYTFRAGLTHEPAGGLSVIQMKDLRDDGIVGLDEVARVSMDSPSWQRVAVRDVILRSRGANSTAAIVAEDPGPAVVAAPLLRIRVTDPRISPFFLAWYINQPAAQGYLAKRAEGTHMKMLSKVTLEGLPVVVPSRERQDQIVRLANLARTEQALITKLGERREALLSAVMLRYAHGDPHPMEQAGGSR